MEEPRATVERVGGYRVVRRLATGGTSDVLLAKAEGPLGFERTVVLKLLLSQYKNDEEFAKMFAREAAAYAKLSHSAIVQLYDFFALDGQLVMVLEYVDGPPLARLRGMLKAVGQDLDDKAAMFIAARIFAALAAAHEVPVIHRDVNPSNVLVPWDGQAKLADFGIAKVTGVTHESAAGLIKGTYGYMAPEQVEGGTITPRADVYAGGIILWELLTKRRAFHRGALPEIEVLRMMAEPKITPIDVLRPDVDKNVREALGRALAPSAEKRNITAEEMVAVLREAAPPEEARARLAELLATIRHEPKPLPTSIPPPNTANAEGVVPSTERLPPPGATTGAGKVLPKTPPRPGGPPRPSSSTSIPKVTPPPKRPPSGAMNAVAGKGTLLGMPMPPPSEGLRLPTPPAVLLPGVSLKEAVPSSIPPGILASKAPPPSAAGPETPRMMPAHFPPAAAPLAITMPLGEPDEGRATIAPDAIANAISSALADGASAPDAAPAPVVLGASTLVSPTAATALAVSAPPPPAPPAIAAEPPRAFGETMREVERAEQPTVLPPNDPNAAAEPFPALDRTLAMDAKVATAPHPAFTPPPDKLPSVPPPGPPPMHMAHSPASISGPAVVGDNENILPAPKPSSVGLIAFFVVIAIAAGVAGTVGYVKYHRTKQTAATTPTPSAAAAHAAIPSASASAVASAAPVPSASASEISSASTSASAAPSALPSASASAAASASPSASAAGSAAPAEIPADMVVLDTTGLAPSHRIYVDEKVVGETPASVTVKCGTHVVKLGSAGKPQTIDLPCGVTFALGDK